MTGTLKRSVCLWISKIAVLRDGLEESMINRERISELASVEIDPTLFYSLEARIMDPGVVRRPQEFFECARQTMGDIIEVTESSINGVSFPTLIPMNPKHPNYLVLGNETVKKVLRDQAGFYQNYGNNMDRLMGEGQIAGLNPPRHKPLRDLIMQGFNKSSVDELEATIVKPIMSVLADEVAEKSSTDVVADFTCRVPTLIICEMFGIQTEDVALFAELVTDVMGIDRHKAIDASQRMKMIFEDLIQTRRSNPGEDLISNMLRAELHGEKLSDHEITTFCRALVPAGIETTTRALSTALGTALNDRDCWKALGETPDLIPSTVEEILRWNGPVMMVPKRTTQETELAGKKLPKDANLWVCLGHANRDPCEWENPNSFDFRRVRKQHLTFSAGAHLCIGNQLARRELVEMLRIFTRRFPNMSLTTQGTDPEVVGIQFRSIDQLDVTTGH